MRTAFRLRVPDDALNPELREEPDDEPLWDNEPKLYTGHCLVWNPETKKAEPGTFTVHPADYIYDPLRGDQ